MGCGLSLCRKSQNSFPESQSGAKTNSIITAVDPSNGFTGLVEKSAESYNYDEDVDDYEKELQQLNEDKTGVEDNVSPPPTLDESMSDHESSPVVGAPIAATVTLKMLESPRSVILSSPSASRPNSGFTAKIPESYSDNIATEPEMALDREDEVNLEERELAAIHIQSAYRGHRARREIASAAMESDSSDLTTNPTEVQAEIDQLDSTKELQEEFAETISEEQQMEEKQLLMANEQPEEEQPLMEDERDASDETMVQTFNEEISEPIVLEEVSEQEAETHMDSAENEIIENVTDELNLAENEESDPIHPIDKIEDILESKAENETSSPREDAAENALIPKEILLDQEDNRNEDNTDFVLEDEQHDIDSLVMEQENENVIILGENDSLVAEENILPNEEKENLTENSVIESTTEQDEMDKTIIEEVVIESEAEQIEMMQDNEEDIQQNDEIKLENEDGTEMDNEMNDSESNTQLAEEHDQVENEDVPSVEEKKDEDVIVLAQESSSDQQEEQEANENNLVEVNETEHDENVNGIETIEGSMDLQEEEIVELEGLLDPSNNVENEIDKSTTEENETDVPDNVALVGDGTDSEAVLCTTSDDVALNEVETAGINTDSASSENVGLLIETIEEVSNENDKEVGDPEIADSVAEMMEVEDKETIPEEQSEGARKTSMNDVIDESLFDSERLESAIMDLEQSDEKISLDKDFDEILDEGDQEISNDDEEEIWRKLQKDIQLEEEEQQNLAAIRIQSSFRGYKARKDLNRASDDDKNDDEKAQDDDEDDHQINDVEQNSFLNEEIAHQEILSTEDNGNDGGVTEALAGLTEAIATVALIMTDTKTQPNLLVSADNKNDLLATTDAVEDHIDGSDLAQELVAIANHNEVSDITEEPLSNGEAIDDVQLIKSYVIKTEMSEDRYHPQEHTINENDTEEEADSKPNPMDVVDPAKKEDDIVVSDPEGVFELYVKSDETINDGLLDSFWQPQQEDIAILPSSVVGSDEENKAATKIQAGYRGHLERKRYKHDDMEQELNTKKELNKSDPVNNPNFDSLEQENNAATKIQAGYRGSRDRKKVKDMKNNSYTSAASDQLPEIFSNDPHLDECDQFNSNSTELENAAATKIQAGYRGHRDRKHLKNLKNNCSENNNEDSGTAEEQSELNVEEYDEIGNRSGISIDENVAATKIQAGYRGHRDRKRVNNLKDRQSENTKCKNESHENDEDSELEKSDKTVEETLLERENTAATKIQAGYRGNKGRKLANDLKDRQNERTHFEKDLLENEVELKMEECDETVDDGTSFERENAAATKIQAGYRGHIDRKKAKDLKDSQYVSAKSIISNELELSVDESVKTMDERENAAATKIQAGYRGHRDRKRINDLKDLHGENQINKDEFLENETEFEDPFDEHLLERENAAATKIQAGYRGNRDRKKTKDFKDSRHDNQSRIENDDELSVDESVETLRELENTAATKIQAGYRGNKGRKLANDLKDRQNERTHFEKDLLENEVELKMEECDETVDDGTSFERENAAATKIQAGYRGHIDRKKAKDLKDSQYVSAKSIISNELELSVDESVKTMDERENAAATKIQAGYRGHRDRKRVQDLKCKNLDSDNNESETELSEGSHQLDAHKLEEENDEASLELENAAATKIQAGYRGHRDRKRIHELKDQIPSEDTLCKEQDLVLEDIENKAATAIQSGYRGYRTRKNMKTESPQHFSE